jgi:hypothetical protein
MWPPMGTQDGSFYFDNQPNLDQFLVNKNMATDDAPIQVQPDTAQIMLFDGSCTAQ